MRRLEREKLGDILVQLGVLTPAEAERVVQAMRRRRDHAKFGQVAKGMGLVREEHILAAVAVQMQLFPGVEVMGLERLLSNLKSPTEFSRIPLRRERRHSHERSAQRAT